MNRKTVFLGGTCGTSTWRSQIIPLLTIGYFDPVVEEWTPECQAMEIEQRETCDYVLYVLTPEMKGVYSIAEVVEDSVKRPRKTVLGLLREANGLRFDDTQWKSLCAVAKMVVANGGSSFYNLNDIANYLNKQKNVEITSATGVEGHLLYCHVEDKYQFRVYDKNHNFIDYDIKHCDLLVKIIDEDASFYKVHDSTYILDHTPETLGL
jgi:hypothetical protein